MRSNRYVFVNCPFDDEYKPLFNLTVFIVEVCGFSVRSALEESNSGESRIEKITRIIRESRFGIHDISRTESNAAGLPRFNMPFELGLFLGMRSLGGTQSQKVALILDRDRFRYQQFLSDLAGHDISHHDSRSDRLLGAVRDWLAARSAAARFRATGAKHRPLRRGGSGCRPVGRSSKCRS